MARRKPRATATVVAVLSVAAVLHPAALGDPGASAGGRVAPPALVVLDPTGCMTLVTTGGGRVRVRSIGRRPGAIAVDTDASGCSGGNFGVDVQGAGGSIAADGTVSGAPGAVRLHALTEAGCNMVDKACDPSDVASGALAPQPAGAERRTGREHVDWRYNCKADYGSQAVGPCPVEAESHLDVLRAEIGAVGLPEGFRDYRLEGYPCDVGPGATVTVPAGNWWVDCRLSVEGALTFTGGNLVVQHGMSIGTSGVVAVNADNPARELPAPCQAQVAGCADESSANHAVAWFRSGGIDREPGGSLHLRNTFVHLDDGGLSLTGGAGTVSWSAPGGYRSAASGPLHGLALWSTAAHHVSGGSGLALRGLFFTPHAQFEYSGNGSTIRTRAQVVAFRVRVVGAGELQLVAAP